MKRCLAVVVSALSMITLLAVPAAGLPIEPIDPPDPPPPGPAPGPNYDQRWAALSAEPGFQAMMAASDQAQYRTTMDGLRSLVANELPIALAAATDASTDLAAPGELEAARQQVLDLLVMPSAAGAPGAPDAAVLSGGAQDPVFCTSAFRGDGLHPSLPGPYGEFAANPANNFCLPNGPYGNDLCTFVPDRGYTFDFRRACYQHDMAYFWTPLSNANRGLIDGQFLLDMTNDCSAAHPWYSLRRYACYTVAGVYYIGVRAFAGPLYANRNVIPGYSRPRLPGEVLPYFRPFVLPGSGSTCLQYSHAWVHGTSATVYRGTTLYPTGVVAAATRVVFDFVNPVTGQIVARHVTQPSRPNCVVHHEPEAFSSWNLPPGRIDVYAKYTRWEAIEDVRIVVSSFTVV